MVSPSGRERKPHGAIQSGQYVYEWRGVPKDFAQAAKWYRNAAEQGYATAQYNLGLMYIEGVGIPKDYVTAYMWLLLAAPAQEEAKVDIEALKKNMTANEITRAKRMASERKK